MGAHVDQIQDTKSQTVVNEVPQMQSVEASASQFEFEDKRPEAIQLAKLQGMANEKAQIQSRGTTHLQFVDNRPETIAFQKMQEIANNSPQVSQFKAFQDMADNSPQVKQAAQLQAMADNYSVQQRPTIQRKENNTGLPDNLKTGMEHLSGMSLDDVKVHRNSDKPAQLNAHAYAQGTDIHLASGQEKHLPHEAWHVVQQKQGRVKPTVQFKDKVAVNDDAALEKEADVMGEKALVSQRTTNGAIDGGNTKGHLGDSKLPQPNSPIVVQLRGANIPTANAMKDQASTAWFPRFKSDTATYETIVTSVKLYYKADADNYGVQLYRLREMQRYLNVWTNKYGPLTQAIPPGRQSTTDKRRLVLLGLYTGIGLEVPQVQLQGFGKAKYEHAGNTVTIVDHIREAAKSEDRRLKNTADWILNGGTTKFYAVTPTGDSTARLDANNLNVNADMAFFPKGRAGSEGDIFSGSALYTHTDYMDQTNVMLKANGRSVSGWNEPGAVAIKDGSTKSQQEIWSLMRHEVQHDLDMNKGRDAQAGAHSRATSFDTNSGGLIVANGQVQEVTGGPLAEADYEKFKSEQSLQRYKTEYRAYSYEKVNPDSKYNRLNNTNKNVAHDGELFTARQLAIFKHIYANYDYTKTGWDANPIMADGRTFRRSIADYFDPDTEGFNKYNSKVVHEFYTALDAVGTEDPSTYLETRHGIDIAPVSAGGKVSDKDDPNVAILKKMIDDMDQIDVLYIFEECPPMLTKIDQHFEGEAKDDVLSELEFYAN